MKLKLKQLKQNSKGFTLVELLVSIALVSVVSVGVFGLLLSSSKSFNNISYSLRLQVESQLAMTQMKEYILDADAGIAWNDTENTLCIVNKDAAKPLTVIKLQNGCIYMHCSGIMPDIPTTDWNILTEHVEDLDFSFAPMTGDPPVVAANPTELTLTLKMKRENKEYTGTQTIALRNAPCFKATWADLYKTLAELYNLES